MRAPRASNTEVFQTIFGIEHICHDVCVSRPGCQLQRDHDRDNEVLLDLSYHLPILSEFPE